MVSAYIRYGKACVELRFTARRAESLEADIGKGLLQGLRDSDKVGTIIKYIQHGAGVSVDEACDIYDGFIENGGSMSEINDIIVEALQNGGFIPKKVVEAAKKITDQLTNREQLQN